MKMKAKRVICPYCGQRAELADSAEIYNGISYGYAYICRYCGDGKSVYVLCKPGTNLPRGVMGDATTMRLRRRAYGLWRQYMEKSSFYNQEEAKGFVAAKLSIPYAAMDISSMQAERLGQLIKYLDSAIAG